MTHSATKSYGIIESRRLLSKLIPLLSSDREGEVVATVAAIGRVLKSQGASWHDLAAVIADGDFDAASNPPQKRRRARRRRFDDNKRETVMRAIDALLVFEPHSGIADFLLSLRDFLDERGFLTDKQMAALHEILRRRHAN